MAEAITEDERIARGTQVSRERGQFAVIGLSCPADAAGLERRLRQVDGVEEVTVNPLTELAYLTYDPGQVDPAALIAEIQRAGYRSG